MTSQVKLTDKGYGQVKSSGHQASRQVVKITMFLYLVNEYTLPFILRIRRADF